MEAKGLVNEYAPKTATGRLIHTLNLACGVTPFGITVGGTTYYSRFYEVTAGRVLVEYVWYRPAREEFDSLDTATQDHVLNGGLLRGPMGHPTRADDPAHHGTGHEEFQEWCLAVYGRRLLAPAAREPEQKTLSQIIQDLVREKRR